MITKTKKKNLSRNFGGVVLRSDRHDGPLAYLAVFLH